MFENINGTFYFKFKKVNGDIRYACATVDGSVINNYHTFSDTFVKQEKPEIQTYFDLDALAFRSFKKDNFLGFCTEEEYNETY